MKTAIPNQFMREEKIREKSKKRKRSGRKKGKKKPEKKKIPSIYCDLCFRTCSTSRSCHLCLRFLCDKCVLNTKCLLCQNNQETKEYLSCEECSLFPCKLNILHQNSATFCLNHLLEKKSCFYCALFEKEKEEKNPELKHVYQVALLWHSPLRTKELKEHIKWIINESIFLSLQQSLCLCKNLNKIPHEDQELNKRKITSLLTTINTILKLYHLPFLLVPYLIPQSLRHICFVC